MMYTVKVAVCSEIRTKHSTQSNLPPCKNLKSNEKDITIHKHSLVIDPKECELYYLSSISSIVMTRNSKVNCFVLTFMISQ